MLLDARAHAAFVSYKFNTLYMWVSTNVGAAAAAACGVYGSSVTSRKRKVGVKVARKGECLKFVAVTNCLP